MLDVQHDHLSKNNFKWKKTWKNTLRVPLFLSLNAFNSLNSSFFIKIPSVLYLTDQFTFAMQIWSKSEDGHFYEIINIDIDIDTCIMSMIDADTVEDVDFRRLSQFFHLKMIISFEKCV